MKKLIFINGAMGVGKSATCRELLTMTPKGVYLDGDWCWNMDPFVVTDETRRMVLDNIAHLLRNFLNCSELENIIFGWVMHRDSIIRSILSLIGNLEFEFYLYTLTCTADVLVARLAGDIKAGIRDRDAPARSLRYLPLYDKMNSIKLDVSSLSPRQAASRIFADVYGRGHGK